MTYARSTTFNPIKKIATVTLNMDITDVDIIDSILSKLPFVYIQNKGSIREKEITDNGCRTTCCKYFTIDMPQ